MKKTSCKCSFTKAVMLNSFQHLHLGRGFTLIELLVVVLIIGILAAVAVPQYQLSVDKVRLSKLLMIVAAVKQAEETYYLGNGSYTNNWNNLSFSFAGTIDGIAIYSADGWKIQLVSEDDYGANAALATDQYLPGLSVYNFYHYNTYWKDHLACYANTSNVRANRLCKSATGKKNRDTTSGTGEFARNVYYFN